MSNIEDDEFAGTLIRGGRAILLFVTFGGLSMWIEDNLSSSPAWYLYLLAFVLSIVIMYFFTIWLPYELPKKWKNRKPR